MGSSGPSRVGGCFFFSRRFLASDAPLLDLGPGNHWMLLPLKTKQAAIAVGACYVVSDLGVCGENIDR